MSVKRFCVRCDRIVEQGHTHRTKDTRLSARKRGYDRQWERIAKAHRAMFPICQWPEGCIRASAHTHHLDGEGPNGPRGHDFENLQSLCHSHHSQLTAELQPGGFAA